MANYIKKILANKKEEIYDIPDLIFDKIEIAKNIKVSSFYNAIFLKKRMSIIAEIKKKSPSVGVINTLSVEKIATEYIKAKVDAISVLTDEKYFDGSFDDVKAISQISKNIPILAKDFIISKKQIIMAKLFGCSAILLIVKAFDNAKDFYELYNFADLLNLDVLVEIENEYELKVALEIKPKIIGVNSRNLYTLEIDAKKFYNLLPQIPNNICKLALSGIDNINDIVSLNGICNGVLIGTSICSLPLDKIADKINQLKSVL